MLEPSTRTTPKIFNGLIVCLLTLLCSVPASLRAQNNAIDDFPPTERKEVGTQWKVKGQVTSTLSRPLSGVKVYITRGNFYQPMGSNRHFNIGEPVVTDFGGNFEINVKEGLLLVFVTSGFAPLAVPVPDGSALDVQMETGRSISGTVTLPSGEPLANARVFPARWLVPREKQRVKPSPTDRGFANNFFGGLPEFGRPWAVKTDARGKFTLSNLPSEYRVGLLVQANGWKEEIVFVRPTDDVAPPDFSKQILLGNGFEYPVEPCSLLTIKATDENENSARIASISTHPDWESTNMFDFRRTESFDSAEVSISRKANPQGTFVYVQPKQSERLLGVRFKLPPNDDIEHTEKKVTFRLGHTVRGRVINAKTGEPIEGVGIKWIPIKKAKGDASSKESNSEMSIPNLEIQTDRDGSFAFAVPNVDAVVGVSGSVKGFCSMPGVHLYRQQTEDFAEEIFDRLTTELKKDELSDLPQIEFRLNPSLDVEVIVVDATGHPTPNAVLAWSKKTNLSIELRESGGASFSQSSTSFSDVTDMHGRALIKQLYDDDFFIALANSFSNNPENRIRHRFESLNPYPITIQAFSIDGFKQGQSNAPLPDNVDGSEPVELTIHLLPGANVLGQIIDETSKGIADLKVTARSRDQSAGQIWTTRSRPDGWFLMQGLPPGVTLRWSLDQTRVKTKDLNIPGNDMAQGKTLTIEPIHCIDYSMLAADLPDIEIGGLSNEDAIQVLLTFLGDSYARIPEKMESTNSDGSFSGGYNNPVVTFKNKVADKAIPIIEELADREPGSEFEMKLLVAAGKLLFYDPRNIGNVGNRATNFRYYCQTRLLKNHADKAEAQELLIDTAAKLPAFKDRNKHLQELYDASPFKKTKVIVAAGMLSNVSHSVTQACKETVTQTAFDKQFSEFDKIATRIEQDVELATPRSKQGMKVHLDYIERVVEHHLKALVEDKPAQPGASTMVESRLNRINSRIKKFKDAIGSDEEN